MSKKFTFDAKWDNRFLQMAQLISTWSKDNDTQVGCVIVAPDKTILSTGYNGFPRGVNDNNRTRQKRPIKYEFYVHAEENAILNAGKCGARLSGAVLYVNIPPCTRCAASIIQSGIREVIYMEPETQENIPGWRDNLKYSFQMFDEAGVKYKKIKYKNLIG